MIFQHNTGTLPSPASCVQQYWSRTLTGKMMHPKMKCLLLIQLLLIEQAQCRTPTPPVLKTTPLSKTSVLEEGETIKKKHQSLLGSQTQLGLPSGAAESAAPEEWVVQDEARAQSAQRIVTTLKAKLQGRILVLANTSCEELLSASTMQDPSSALFPRELLGLSLVPVLVAASCSREAQILVLRMYNLLGVEDTEELLIEVESLMATGVSHPTATTPLASHMGKVQAERHLQAVMFNIQQLARAGVGQRGHRASGRGKQEERCQGWTRVNGTLLLGETVQGATTGGLEEAVSVCESLGSQCAGVSRNRGQYQAVLMSGSRVVPSEDLDSECWIRQCQVQDEESPGASGRRVRRSPQRNCVNKKEEHVYNVVEWVPVVSTLYNLGTAVYYTSVNCSETAKERAILSAVDLGTDTLMAVTGGTVGVAGYVAGAGVKTGVKAGIKYLLSSMKQEEDLIVNEYSWEEGVITIQ
uniref:Apolipoprotein F n=1 Tax=Hucho hucho TaxID=62062 RepID=A0A4W5KDZ4_9TELE